MYIKSVYYHMHVLKFVPTPKAPDLMYLVKDIKKFVRLLKQLVLTVHQMIFFYKVGYFKIPNLLSSIVLSYFLASHHHLLPNFHPPPRNPFSWIIMIKVQLHLRIKAFIALRATKNHAVILLYCVKSNECIECCDVKLHPALLV